MSSRINIGQAKANAARMGSGGSPTARQVGTPLPRTPEPKGEAPRHLQGDIRSKVRISPAFAPMGPRFSLPHQVGAYCGGGGLQHVSHVINVSESLARQYYIPD